MIKQLTAALAATAMMVGAASADSISFADEADTNGERGVADFTVVTISGIDIRLAAGTLDGNGLVTTNGFSAYLDATSGGQPAGLGVCRELNQSAQCVDSGDDSIDGDFDINEAVNLFFTAGSISYINGLSFRDGAHNLINDSLGLIQYNIGFLDSTSTGLVTSTFADLVALAAAGLANVRFINLGYAGTEFYLESIETPIPGALPLLISGLAGLGFASRKKKAA